jgi:hypothetical protein
MLVQYVLSKELCSLLSCGIPLQPRLGDGNSKVSVQALETLGHLFVSLRERSTTGLNTLLPAMAACLGSTNEKIRSAACQAAEKLVASVEPALLVQVL